MTPPRIRGLIDKVARAAKLECFASKEDKPARRRELLKAKMDALNAFALLSEPKPPVQEPDYYAVTGEFSCSLQKDYPQWAEGDDSLKIMGLYAAPQPSDDLAKDAWPKLERPAKVGAGVFSAGVSARLVVEAAYRQHTYATEPPFTDEQISELAKFLKSPAAMGSKGDE